MHCNYSCTAESRHDACTVSLLAIAGHCSCHCCPAAGHCCALATAPCAWDVGSHCCTCRARLCDVECSSHACMGTMHSLHDHCMLAVSPHAHNARLAAACVTTVPHLGHRMAVHALASALWVCAAGSHAPVEHGSVTLSAAAIATAASAALPPLRSILSPISDARGCDEAATPCVHTTFDRRDTNGNASDIVQAARCTRPRCTLTVGMQTARHS